MNKFFIYSVLVCVMFFDAAQASSDGKNSPESAATGCLPSEEIYYAYSKEFFFKDSTGDNVLLITKDPVLSKKTKSDPEGVRSQEIHASRYLHYGLKDGVIQRQLVWRINDGVHDCPSYTGLDVDFDQKGIRITDLDNNGQSEVWVTYRLACQGGIDPTPMKIIMYEGKQKYALRGNNKVCVSAEEYMGGDYKVDAAFIQKPIFKKYAEELWKELNSPVINGIPCKIEAKFN